MIEAITAVVIANATVLAVLGFLLKSLIGQFLEKDLSRFKQSLEDRALREIEAYKAQLEKERLRLQISYGGIFEKQATAILELYRGLTEFESAATQAIHGGGTVSERRETFRRPWAAVRRLYHENRILLPQEIDEALVKFVDDLFLNASAYTRSEMRDAGRMTDEQFEQLIQKQDKILEVIERELPPIREMLVASMRKALGVVP